MLQRTWYCYYETLEDHPGDLNPKRTNQSLHWDLKLRYSPPNFPSPLHAPLTAQKTQKSIGNWSLSEGCPLPMIMPKSGNKTITYHLHNTIKN